MKNDQLDKLAPRRSLLGLFEVVFLKKLRSKEDKHKEMEYLCLMASKVMRKKA